MIGDVDMVSTIAWIALLAFAFVVLLPRSRSRSLPPATRRDLDRAERKRRADLTPLRLFTKLPRLEDDIRVLRKQGVVIVQRPETPDDDQRLN